ncbi:N4-gp56 family major capsid protein [Listeria monocytogenes]|uniref:N4-gp56 family major capsid protein n=1 Tax=Listeria monocytogenes TaxID=1639 RepID=A0A3T2CS16_LISMN|nr:N4-gp56 family major capsid protein [Listeria monocytogenes]MBC1478028.1 N4-gp56 family major capsid protein [Listeria welshimeri]MDA35183.1 N4-gp56 family major capsid protein [Listeria monocytogenes serotype 1/2a]ASH42173.1 major head phage protein [Listeria monocytogenes serotype 1/2a str. 10-0812]ASH45057.1 major head phage protein [Listeria monocytogenes serotype 1/2a str. 10-0813]EAA0272927.1 N4-gp56 family major capsid protein [Listeria monocytogenes]
MADLTTKLANLIDPEVMAPMISAQLPKAIKFGGIAPIDNSLEGQPGSEITVPKFKYIGDAQDVAEGAAIDYSALETESVKHGIKKAGKGVKITDEAVLSGYGNPVGEAQTQIRMSIASKVDNDILAEALTTTLEVKSAINIDLIDQIENTFVDAPDAIEDEAITSTGVLFLNHKDAAKLRKEAAESWTRASQLGDNLLVKGVFGELLGWEIVRTKKLTVGTGLAVKAGALKTFLKRNILAEVGRDMDHKLTKFNADQHYAVALVDETKAVKVVPVSGN